MAVKLPADPIMLMSVLNTKLRDEYDSLDALCEDLGAEREELTAVLSKIGFEYQPELNRFA